MALPYRQVTPVAYTTLFRSQVVTTVDTRHVPVSEADPKGKEFVVTRDGHHVLQDGSGNEVREWGAAEQTTELAFSRETPGEYTLTDPDQVVTTVDTRHVPVR